MCHSLKLAISILWHLAHLGCLARLRVAQLTESTGISSVICDIGESTFGSLASLRCSYLHSNC